MADVETRSEDKVKADVVIAGAGPAGRWLGAQLALCGVSVVLVDPGLDGEWPNSYGVWLDEVAELLPQRCFARTWEEVAVHLGQPLILKRGYGRLHNHRFRRWLDEILNARGARLVGRKVLGVSVEEGAAVVDCDGGVEIEATVVVDATGGKAGLASPVDDTDVAFQRAYGMVACFDGDPLEGMGMVLMDYRPADNHIEGVPSFLYGMHLGGDRYFVEETVLVGPRTVGFELLRRRLFRRLRALGVRRKEKILEEERCHIPMGTTLPEIQGPLFAFGASAGLVHPATGYQMGRMLRAAPAVAAAVAHGLERRQPGDEIARQAWDVLWPPDVRRARRLLIFGREVLRHLERQQLCRFFETFFGLPAGDWRDYLCGEANYRRLSRIMWRLFGRLDTKLRWSLARRAVVDRRRLMAAMGPV